MIILINQQGYYKYFSNDYITYSKSFTFKVKITGKTLINSNINTVEIPVPFK